jgi:hypothetical protein
MVDMMILRGLGRQNVTHYVHGMSCIAICILQASVELV